MLNRRMLLQAAAAINVIGSIGHVDHSKPLVLAEPRSTASRQFSFPLPPNDRRDYLQAQVDKFACPPGFRVKCYGSAHQPCVVLVFIDDWRRAKEKVFRCSNWATDIYEQFWESPDEQEVLRMLRMRHGLALRELR